MADQAKIDELVGRAVRDKKFRQKLAENPKDALKDLNLPDAEIDKIVGGVRKGVQWCTDKKCYESG